MKIKKILITGISGAAGSYFAEYVSENYPEVEIHGISRHINKFTKKARYKNHMLDLCDFPSLFSVIKKNRPDVIFHLASSVDVADSFIRPSAYINNNINITLNILEIVRTLKETEDYNPIIQLCSTSEIYGDVSEIITEETPINPINPYAISKVCQDNLGSVYFKNYGLNIHRIRMFSYFNARRNNLAASMFAKQIIDIENGKLDILSHGNLESKRSILDIRDVVKSYWIGALKCKAGEAYNVAAEEIVSIKDILKFIN